MKKAIISAIFAGSFAAAANATTFSEVRSDLASLGLTVAEARGEIADQLASAGSHAARMAVWADHVATLEARVASENALVTAYVVNGNSAAVANIDGEQVYFTGASAFEDARAAVHVAENSRIQIEVGNTSENGYTAGAYLAGSGWADVIDGEVVGTATWEQVVEAADRGAYSRTRANQLDVDVQFDYSAASINRGVVLGTEAEIAAFQSGLSVADSGAAYVRIGFTEITDDVVRVVEAAYEQGFADGFEAGYEAGYADGYAAGFEAGRNFE